MGTTVQGLGFDREGLELGRKEETKRREIEERHKLPGKGLKISHLWGVADFSPSGQIPRSSPTGSCVWGTFSNATIMYLIHSFIP